MRSLALKSYKHSDTKLRKRAEKGRFQEDKQSRRERKKDKRQRKEESKFKKGHKKPCKDLEGIDSGEIQ